MIARRWPGVLFGSLFAASAAFAELHVEVFQAKAANVNSFVFYDSTGSLIVDATRNSRDALKVAKIARAHGGGPKIIFLTHGHPDHYVGMGALRREFPGSRVFVANQQVKDDIIRFAEAADKGHWRDDEPLVKPKSPDNPGGFDYQREINVLAADSLELPGGEKLQVRGDFPPTEAAHETVLFSRDLNALFASDLVYNGVHLWLGRGVDASAVANWRAELKKLKAQCAPLHAKVYPGHGAPADAGVFDTDLRYLRDFLAIVRASATADEAKAKIIKKYPGWENRDFILAQSVKNQFELLKKSGPRP